MYGGEHAPGNVAVNTRRIVIIQQDEKEIIIIMIYDTMAVNTV